MRILLVYPKWTKKYGFSAHFAKKGSTWTPLNLAYLASVAINKGHTVQIIDGEVENLSKDEMVNRIEAFKPDILGLSATTPFYHLSLELASDIKKSNPVQKIVIGGSHITMVKEKAFDKVFDYGVIGEGEMIWSELLDHINGTGKKISEIKGLLYHSDDKVIFTGNQELISDLDTIPIPARHLLKNNEYKIGTIRGIKRFTTIMTSRGCPFKCIFCSTKTFGQRVRRRKLANVINEIKSVISDFGIRHFIFLDDTLTLDRKYILELCDMLEKEKISITFEGSTCASYLDEELMKAMARNGLVKLAFGLETVNQETRKLIKKVIPLESYPEANRLARKYGVETLNSIVLGLPNENKEMMKNTLQYVEKARDIQNVTITIATPYPGTEMYDMAEKGEFGLKILSKDFSKYVRFDRAVMESENVSAKELVNLQNDGFFNVYSAWWRIIPVFRKSGFFGLVLTFSRLITKLKRQVGELINHNKRERENYLNG